MTDRNGKPARPVRALCGLTLVEMLVAMAITLLIMAAVVTVFANVSGSVTRRRATIEMASSLRQVRQQLARDLAGATCPAVPWQRPESNVGYLEIIEGPQNDYYPSPWLWDGPDDDSLPDNIGNRPGIDLAISSLPGSNLGSTDPDVEGRGLAIGSNQPLDQGQPTDGRGLGDADDILMFTTRSEDEPFVGRIPKRIADEAGDWTPFNSAFGVWSDQFEEAESQVAEVVWFALENPTEADGQQTFAFGEPGYRTIYRRALLILPNLDYGIDVIANGIDTNPVAVSGVQAKPGVVRVLPPAVGRDQVASALAALIAFQDRYDLSVRLEWDPLLPDGTIGGAADESGRWVIRCNTLADLTKRENRYEHHGLVSQPQAIWYQHGAANARSDRFFPFAVASGGVHSSATAINVVFTSDPELGAPTAASQLRALTTPQSINSDGSATTVVAFDRGSSASLGAYAARPLATVDDARDRLGTARAVLDEDGRVVHLTAGLAPLGGLRRGDDVMITDALAFDLRVYDPAAPLYAYYPRGNVGVVSDQVVGPGEPAWVNSHFRDVFESGIGDGLPATTTAFPFRIERQGAYVDLAYGLQFINPSADPAGIPNRFTPSVVGPNNPTNNPRSRWDDAADRGLRVSDFFFDGLIRASTGPNALVVQREELSRRFATYDTWSAHYESNGVNEDGDQPSGSARSSATDPIATDEGTDGLDSSASYDDDQDGAAETLDVRNGPDDYAERETRPPYETALRGLQVALRVYERDSRQIREVKVRESFVPE